MHAIIMYGMPIQQNQTALRAKIHRKTFQLFLVQVKSSKSLNIFIDIRFNKVKQSTNIKN